MQCTLGVFLMLAAESHLASEEATHVCSELWGVLLSAI